MLECIQFDKERKYIDDFLSLPKQLYTNDDNMEDPSMVKKILLGKHPLSKYFTISKFLIYSDGVAEGRFILTQYPHDTTIYIGFFECTNNHEVAQYLFYAAKHYAKKMCGSKIVGPVDASFWIKYRLKINLFDKTPYTGESYNKNYYLQLFENNEFTIIEHYTSHIFKIPNDEYINDRFKNNFEKCRKNGYIIRSPLESEYDKTLKEIYYLLMDLYSDFPIFKSIELEDFVNIFKTYKLIMNFDMVKIAYKDGKNVGFFISLPNYSNKVYHLNNIENILKVLKLKKQPQEFVMLYMGADREHKGIGSALAESILQELKKYQLPSIGALMRDGKATQSYASDLIEDKYEYVLLERNL